MKRYLIIFAAFIISTIFSTGVVTAAEAPLAHHIGFQDQLLDFSDVKVINQDTKVPLEEIAAYLDIPFEIENGITYIRKNGIEISYNEKSQLTAKDEVALDWSPIVKVDGKLFISVEYLAIEIGYKMKTFEKQKTQRIYKEDWAHMSHANFEIYLDKLLNKKQPSQATPKANVYLTFDDGPNKFTTTNNSILKKYNAKATFFFLGNHMKKNSSIINAVVKDGHYIGTHSMTHDKSKVYLSSKAFINEMIKGTKLIKKMTGKDTKLVRTPYGSKPHITTAMKDELVTNGFKLWDWDVDSNDWKYTDKEANKIVQNVQVGVEKAYKSGDRDIIILLHDRSQTTKALPQIIEWLQKEGFTLKTYEPDHHIVQNFLRDTTL
ncbi:polysaccharide deacetylase [Psychrobacillus sp. NEAU-3TGS]|uniref:polysaccharide deacetylase family protein n=1 Tax=Psychrobacillus sp. NEAU-3TGS TaxID=2995412 RepID=UPI0024990262|nr:polysaccharide deacetylase family protein [Psychrobacillus sp. NEAU-3TGS]MDI2587064.1 polysaccharide deacetylase [Psychrobacillus sp. NEAU-3TGS]